MRNSKAAFLWIDKVLKDSGIKYEIDGGLAAELYGSKRELADIDINVPREDFWRLVPLVKSYIKFGPGRYKDEHWDLLMMTLKYAGQNIDVGALGEIKYYDSESSEWINFPNSFEDNREMEYLGQKVSVINEIKLMIYKNKLHRGVDRKDVLGMLRRLFKIK